MHFRLAYFFTAIALYALITPRWAVAAEPTTATAVLAESGKSEYVIYIDNAAPGSVKAAASELSRVIGKSTGAQIALRPTPGSKTIFIGESDATRAAGVTADDLKMEGYRILVKDQQVYILGQDSRRNRVGWGGNEETGTLFGTYAFLERTVGARWLMPGELGEDIPKHSTLAVGQMEVTSTPFFSMRDIGGDPKYTGWTTRNGGGGWHVDHNHNWASFPKRSVIREHPEYMALQRGKRMAVPADDKEPFAPKYCTTNPQFIQAFAESVIEDLQSNPQKRFFSLTPTDGGGWCECDACMKLTVAGPSTKWGDFGMWQRSVTPLVLKYYNDVAKIVGRTLPDRVLCGYVYYDFLYPLEPQPPTEPNLSLMIAPLQHYGMTRYKPELRTDFERVCRSWSEANNLMGYYGVSAWMRNGIGAPLGPSIRIHKHTFTTLKQNNFKFVYLYTVPWSASAVANYLVAKLMWNPDADVDALFDEYMIRSFGPGGAAMGEAYRLIDRETEAAKIASPLQRADYEMTSELAISVYAKNFAAIEALYIKAMSATTTDAQKARLKLFGDNMVILHRVLSEGGVLADADKSIFRRTPEEFRAFQTEGKGSRESAVSVAQRAGDQGGITGVTAPRPKTTSGTLAPRALTVPRLRQTTAPPRIDGDLSDAAWREAAAAEQDQSVADRFTLIGGASAPKNVTRALVTYDEENLYINFRCSDAQVVSQDRSPENMGIYEDDCVQVFIAPSSEKPDWFWHLTLNATNSRWDALTLTKGAPFEPRENLNWQSATTSGEGYWAAEIKIPFKSIVLPGSTVGLTGPPVGQTWRVNLARQDKPSSENSSWSPVSEGFRNPSEMGRFYFPR